VTLSLYIDENVAAAITQGLRRRGVDVLTVQEDGREAAPDPEVLDRAGELGRVVFTRDEDFLQVASRRQHAREAFPGVIYAHPLRASIGQCVRDLELLAGCLEPGEIAGRVQHLPFR